MKSIDGLEPRHAIKPRCLPNDLRTLTFIAFLIVICEDSYTFAFFQVRLSLGGLAQLQCAHYIRLPKSLAPKVV